MSLSSFEMTGSANSSRVFCRHPKAGAFSIILVIGVVTGISLLAYVSFGIKGKAEPTLRFLSILHRHGERNPKPDTFPLDPYTNESLWPEGKGELTKKGIQTLFEVGTNLRKRYDGFIPSKYKQSELLAVSSYMDRCIMSGLALLAGLYPPAGDQIWNPEVHWQPIPIHAVTQSTDNMFLAQRPCAKLIREKQYVFDTIWRKIRDENQELIDYINKNTGLAVESYRQLEDLYDYLLIVSERGLKLPEWAVSVFPGKLKSMFTFAHTTFTMTPTIKKLFSGVLINDVVISMRKKRDSKESFKRLVNLYSAHDLTLRTFLINMGVKQEVDLPGYGATVILELHEINGKYRVKILYTQHGRDKDAAVMTIEGCEKDQDTYHDDMCDLDNFISILEPLRVTDFDKECVIDT